MNTSPAIRAIRIACAVIFAMCIPGLIISSIAGNNEGWVLSIGLCGALAAVILIVVSLVTSTKRVPEFSDVRAEAIEQRITQLVAAGVDENELRELVRSSIQLGQGL
jgi:hypothetical protein